MNTLLVQYEQFLLSSLSELDDLAKKQKSRILVVSDSHGNFNVLLDIVETFASTCDALVFCGDGMDDLAILVEKASNDDKLLAILPSVISFVRGNCDAENYEVNFAGEKRNLKCGFSSEFVASGRKIFVTHGHKSSVNITMDFLLSKASEANSDIVFYGHTHIPHYEENDGTLILNPGSCSMPRSTDIPSFAIVEFPGIAERYDVQFFGIQTGPFGKNSFFRVNF